MRSWALALVLLAGCGGGSSEEDGEALASEDAITSTSLSFSAAGTPINLNVSGPKNLDLTVEAAGRTIGLQLFLADSQIASGLGKDTARIRSFPVVAGTYRLVVKDLGPNPSGGNFTFTGGLATSRVIRTTAEGYLVGAGANDAATAKSNWAAACKKWQALVFAVSPGHEGDIELVDCGEPEAMATVAGGKRQVESKSRVVVVVDERPDGSRIPVRDEHSTGGDTRPTAAEAHSAWMDQCFIDMLAQTDLDRRLGHFVTVACTKPRGFDQQPGISDSSPFKKWIFAE